MKVMWPENVGIVAIEILFPAQYVDQAELEKFDGASEGKYTIGLGQSRMGFCTDREDVNSLCLTVVARLLERYQVNHSQIGRLEVGTETIIDKSKSVKSVLMQLFEPLGVTDVEGIDTTNACYGGTAAVFNAINWMESSSWDGRLGLAVCADIAVYSKGNARPTGGAGAVAMLIGPNAPLVFDRGLRSSYMKHAYDFYKPNLSSEYPTVDGKLSIQCYLSALDNCYQLYRKKYEKKYPGSSKTGIDTLDSIVFHSPFCKLVQKSVARLVLNDFLLTGKEKQAMRYPDLYQFCDLKLEDTYFDRDVEKAFMTSFSSVFHTKTKPSLLIANQVGNMYTPSVYSGLVSLLINTNISELVGQRVALFSYGSGLAATMFSITITGDVNQLERLTSKLNYVKPMLESRQKVSPQEFSQLMELREKTNHTAPYEPVGNIDTLHGGSFYLKYIDGLHRRTYERKPVVNG